MAIIRHRLFLAAWVPGCLIACSWRSPQTNRNRKGRGHTAWRIGRLDRKNDAFDPLGRKSRKRVSSCLSLQSRGYPESRLTFQKDSLPASLVSITAAPEYCSPLLRPSIAGSGCALSSGSLPTAPPSFPSPAIVKSSVYAPVRAAGQPQ